MNGWMLQWYAYLPAFASATVAEAPGAMSPVSNELPSSAVAVCAVLSSLLTTIRVPRVTANVAGANLKLSILMVPADFGDDPFGRECDGLGVTAPFALAESLEPPHAAAGPA